MMRRLALGLLLMLTALPGRAQDFTALARLLPDSAITDSTGGFAVRLGVSQPVPYRIFYLVDPYRVVFDFSELQFPGGAADNLDQSGHVLSVRTGALQPGWSRMVLELDAPFRLASAELSTAADMTGTLVAEFVPASAEDFAAIAGVPDGAGPFRQAVDTQPTITTQRQPGEPLRVVLDPGHGGIDPGAEVEDDTEADLMLGFARELKELLLRSGDFAVTLTREEDVFVALEGRVSAAHDAGADVFLSLHADVVLEGQAAGATIYTLSADASDAASEKLAERHDRADLLSGVDLSNSDDEIALILMDMARTDTAHRSDMLARALVRGLEEKVELYRKPRLSAGFSVLKAPDIPSVLIELGFMSSPHDLANLRDPDWRRRAAEGIRDALFLWAAEDAAEAGLRRQ